MIQNFQLPSPPPESDASFQGWLKWVTQYGNTLYTYLNTWEQALAKQFNTLFNDYGKDIVAAANTTVSAAVHQVTGSTTITTLSQPPGQTAVSMVTLLAKDGFALASTGNVQNAASIPKGGSVALAYHPALKKWLTIPGNPIALSVSTSSNSPYAVGAGGVLFVAADTANFIANLSATPQIGDTVTVKTVSGFSTVLTPAAGQQIDNQPVGNALNVPATQTAQLMWTGTSWQSLYKST